MNKPEMTAAPQDRESLISDLRSLIVNSVNLHHLKMDEIKADTPLGSSGLNLDSVDILEVVVAVEQRYKIKVQDAELGRKYFGTIGGIADFITEQRS